MLTDGPTTRWGRRRSGGLTGLQNQLARLNPGLVGSIPTRSRHRAHARFVMTGRRAQPPTDPCRGPDGAGRSGQQKHTSPISRQRNPSLRGSTMQRRSRVTYAGLFLIAITGGCAGSGLEGPIPRGGSGPLTSSELADPTYGSLYDAVAALRPRWLRRRGSATVRNPDPVPRVHVDNVRQGGFEELRILRTQDVERVELISPVDATTRWGTGHASGAIYVRTRRGG